MKRLRINIMVLSITLFMCGVLTSAQPQPVSTGEVGTASYYSYECANSPMANGDAFNPEEKTCASWFYDFGTVLIVKNLENGRSTEVIVTDRGPNKRYVEQGRIIDLSKRAFQDIAELKDGLARVHIRIKGK